jgi:hypothetical protein
MNTDIKKIGLVPYWLMILLTALIGRYVSIYVACTFFILAHILFALFSFKERMGMLTWLLFGLSVALPWLISALDKTHPAFYQAMGTGLHFGLLPIIDGYYIIYGGVMFGLICLGLLYQNTSFYNVGFGKGGGGFFILSGLALIMTVLCYHSAFK